MSSGAGARFDDDEPRRDFCPADFPLAADLTEAASDLSPMLAPLWAPRPDVELSRLVPGILLFSDERNDRLESWVSERLKAGRLSKEGPSLFGVLVPSLLAVLSFDGWLPILDCSRLL